MDIELLKTLNLRRNLVAMLGNESNIRNSREQLKPYLMKRMKDMISGKPTYPINNEHK